MKNTDLVTELEKLTTLKKEGALTESEFLKAKELLMNQYTPQEMTNSDSNIAEAEITSSQFEASSNWPLSKHLIVYISIALIILVVIASMKAAEAAFIGVVILVLFLALYFPMVARLKVFLYTMKNL